MAKDILDAFFILLIWIGSGAARLGTGAQVSSWAYQPDVRQSRWPDARFPRLFEDFSLFFTRLPEHDDDRDDVARGRYLRYSVLGWKWLRFAATCAYLAATLQLAFAILKIVFRLL